MMRARWIQSALTIGATFVAPVVSSAQNISSGSGAGTGTGSSASSGLGTTGTGRQSGNGLGTTGTGNESGASRRGPTGVIGGSPARDQRVGAPRESFSDPSLGRPLPGQTLTGEELKRFNADLLPKARLIQQPSERALAMEKVARIKIIDEKFDEAHAVLVEAGQAALAEPSFSLRDRRMVGIVQTWISLAERELTEGTLPESFGSKDPAAIPVPAADIRLSWIKKAQGAWDDAAELASQIGSRNFQGEMLFRVIESRATGSAQVADESTRTPGDSKTRPNGSPELADQADHGLVKVLDHAKFFKLMVWHDQALDVAAARAAASGQFERGRMLAAAILRPEIRTSGYLKVAVAQTRLGFNKEATVSYEDAVRAVASIPTTDPRITLTGVLIDSLISAGRFDDARATIELYPDPIHKDKALGAVAESQGRRGLADEALAWIDRDAPNALRSYLRRRVADGMLAALEQNRTETKTMINSSR